MKLAKNQAKAKQCSEAELLLFKICFLHPRYHPKVTGHILKSAQNSKFAFFNEIVSLKVH